MRRSSSDVVVAAVLAVVLLGLPRLAGAAQSSIGVTEGTDAEVATESRTQGGSPVHDEVVNAGFSTTTTKAEGPVTATSSSAPLFGGATPCWSATLKADPANAGPVWVRRQSGATSSNSFPLFAGEAQQFSAPNSRDCADIFLIEGTGCGGACKLYVLTH